MIFAYQSWDCVNQEYARDLAARQGITLLPLRPADRASDEDADCVIYDFDHCPLDVQKRIAADLLKNQPQRPVAVHSYRLDDDKINRLRANGVAVFRVLGSELFEEMRDALASSFLCGPANSPGDLCRRRAG
jgi:hypothetical protein